MVYVVISTLELYNVNCTCTIHQWPYLYTHVHISRQINYAKRKIILNQKMVALDHTVSRVELRLNIYGAELADQSQRCWTMVHGCWKS